MDIILNSFYEKYSSVDTTYGGLSSILLWIAVPRGYQNTCPPPRFLYEWNYFSIVFTDGLCFCCLPSNHFEALNALTFRRIILYSTKRTTISSTFVVNNLRMMEVYCTILFWDNIPLHVSVV